MKLSPFVLFIILILVLVVATTFGRKEGFISFGQSTSPLSSALVAGYNKSTNITKLYDDIYYDSKNGNVVFLSETGGTVNKIDIMQRDPTAQTVSYSKGRETEFSDVTSESTIDTILQTYSSYITSSVTTNLIYNAWGNDTHLYLIDVTNSAVQGNSAVVGNTAVKPVLTVSYNGKSRDSYNTNFANVSIPIVPSYTQSSDPKNNTLVSVTSYSTRALYQLVPTVFYDISNGNLLVKNGTTYDVYERGTSEKSTNTLANLSGKSFSQFTEQPSFIMDTEGNNTIIYHPLGEYTHIMVLGNTLNDKLLKVVNSKKFDMNGVYQPTVTQQIEHAKQDEIKEDNKIKESDLLDAFSKWYMYFYGKDFVDNSENSKYLLKTQVVPPVCPSCPGCSGNGICTDCGGKGGSGTRDVSGSLAFSDGKTLIGATGNAVSNAVGATGNVVSNTVGATGKVLTGAVDTTGAVVTKTVDTAGNVVTGVVGKTLDTAGNVVEKTFDTAGNIIGSAGRALGLDRVGYSQSYGGPVNTSSSANAQGYGYNRNLTGYSSLPNGNPRDPYSYNGQLQSKGANFIPVTADFSSFGR